jgi:hypothetical protein
MVHAAWVEKIMCKTNDTFRAPTEADLDDVSGGVPIPQ